MTADAISFDEFAHLCRRAEQGDMVYLKTTFHEYTKPLEVRDAHVATWKTEDGYWHVAGLVLIGSHGSEHRLLSVENEVSPRLFSSNQAYSVVGLELERVPLYTTLDPDDDLDHLDIGVSLSHVTLADVVQAVDECETQYEVGDRLRLSRTYVKSLLRNLGLWETFQSDAKNVYEVQGEVMQKLRERVDRPEGDDSWKAIDEKAGAGR